MKNEFINKLEENEELLFYGVSDVSKVSKQFGRFLLGVVILLLFWTLIIILIRNGLILLNSNIFMFVIILGILTICLIYGLVYNILLKYKSKNNEYFVTNKRIALYTSKNGFRIEKISDIEYMGVTREKNNYGDISFNFYANNLIEQIKNSMGFEGVENPRNIISLISNINNRINIWDDRPTVMGKKI